MSATDDIEKLDARQASALAFYIDPTSETFGDTSKSMIKAGFAPSTARNAGRTAWLKEHRANYSVEIVKSAEKLLQKYLAVDINLTPESNRAEIDIARLQSDLLKFSLERLASGQYNKDADAVTPQVTINVTQYQKPSATRDAQVVEPDALYIEEQGATRDAPSA
jgi:hypothetical protein